MCNRTVFSWLFLISVFVYCPLALYAQATDTVDQNEDSTNSPALQSEEAVESEESENPEEDNPETQTETSTEKDTERSQEKANYKEQRKQKRLARELAALKIPEKLVFENEVIALYSNRYGINWLSPYYSLRKTLFVNKTDSEINIVGDIFNKIANEEAKAKVEQIARQKKEQADHAQNAGALSGGLLGVAVMAGGYAAHKKIDRSRASLLRQISELLEDKPFQLTLTAGEEKIVRFLIPREKDLEPSMTLTYPEKIENGEVKETQRFYFQGIDEDLAKRFILEPELYQFAYIDEQISDKEIGLYFVNEPRPKYNQKRTGRRKSRGNTSLPAEVDKKIDESYLKANSLETISIEDFKMEVQPKTSRRRKSQKKSKRKPKTTYRFPGLTSQNVFPAKDFRIFVYQNIKKQPVKGQIEFIKLTVNKKENYRTVVRNQIPFYLKEIKPGISELRPTARVIRSGEYLINLSGSNGEKSYIFSILKPERKTRKR